MFYGLLRLGKLDLNEVKAAITSIFVVVKGKTAEINVKIHEIQVKNGYY